MAKGQAVAKPEPAPKKPAGLRIALWLGALCALALLGGAGYFARLISDPAAIPIRKVTVEGDFVHLTQEHVQKLVSEAVHGGFFQVDVAAIRSRILDEPWLYDANVRRVWPDTISVSIREQQAVAAWGETSLLNAEGDIFAPDAATLPTGLVRLRGPVGTELEVLSTYRSIESRLARLGLHVAALSLSDRRALVLELAGGTTVIVGKHAVENRLARFQRVFDTLLREHWAQIAVVDLRYTNGFAIRRRDEVPGAEKPGRG